MLTPEEIEDYGWRLTGGAEAVLMAEVLDLLVSRFAMVFSLDIEDVIALNAVAAAGGDLETALSALIARYNPVVKAEAAALTYELLERGDALEATRLSREFGKAARPLTEQAMQAAVGVAQIVGRDNVSMGQLAEQAWWKACTRVTLGCMSGEKSLDELIAEGVGYLAEKGVSAVTYVDDAGNVTRTDSVDVAVRRHAITQANQAGGRMTIQRMQEFGHDLVQTTAHMGARPTHEPWQGRAFSLSGPREVDGVTYPNFYEETGYGTVSGLQGANCRHTFYSYFPGDPLPERPDPEENAERYRAEQKQRRIEREIRRCKRDIAADEAALETLSGPERTGAVEERLTRNKARLKGLQAKMREHVGSHDYLVRQPKREKDYMGRASAKGFLYASETTVQLRRDSRSGDATDIESAHGGILASILERLMPSSSGRPPQALGIIPPSFVVLSTFISLIKKKATDARVRRMIRNGEIPTNIAMGAQRKHVRGTNEYNQRHAAVTQAGSYGPSYLGGILIKDGELDVERLEGLVQRYAGTGNLHYDDDLQNMYEIILDNPETIGTVVNNRNGTEVPTSVFKIHYSRKGVHIVPDYPSKANNRRKRGRSL